MSKVQGKQIANHTIEQNNLNLVTPNSGDTTSGATVNYVNNYVSSLSGTTVIGPAEDIQGYVDGIFTDFTETTRIGVAIDRFNEMLLLLAPTPPSDNWNNVFSNLAITPIYSPRALTTGTVTSNVTYDTTPTYTLTDTIGTGVNAKSRDTERIFTFVDNGVTGETVTIDSSSTGKTSGIITYTIADPYAGISGEAGFWTGITAFNVTGTLSTITSSSSSRLMIFSHPGTDSPESLTYYIDNPLTPAISNLSVTMPAMTRYISGVPSLASGAIITLNSFNIINVSSYFYASSYVWSINGSLVASLTGDPDNIPTIYAETGIVTNKTTIVNNSVYSDTSFSFTLTPRNSRSINGTTSGYTNGNYRVDTVSNESARLTSSNGSYPSIGWGGTWNSNSGVSLLTNTDEMMMKNGIYQYPSGNYTAFGGPDYSSISNIRWVTYNIGTFNNKSAFTLNFIGSSGILVKYNQSNLLVEVIISGATYWVDGDAAYSGVGNPGSNSNGVGAVVDNVSTPTSRRITFGSITYSGAIIVRVGLTGSGVTFTNLTATNIV
jgi:hypothetical protein